MFDMFKIMAKLSTVKGKLKEVKEKLPFIGITEESTDGYIKVAITAEKEIKVLEINEILLQPSAKKELEEKLKETLNIAIQKAEEKNKEEVKKAIESEFPELAGIDLASLLS
jgi:nucleoid-associated protein EbfC